MILIKLQDIGVSIGGAQLFSSLSLSIHKNNRIGLVAANGCGKTTLLRLLAGHLEASTGEKSTAKSLRVGYVPQQMPDDLTNLTAYEVVTSGLGKDPIEAWRIGLVLDDLKVPADSWQKPLQHISGGWQRIVLFARAWISEPDILIIDEPTNHLDLRRIGVLQDFLTTSARNTAFVIASHDRAFLDTVTSHTLFLRADQSHLIAHPFTRARIAVDEADACAEREFNNSMARSDQLRKQAVKLKNIGINSRSDLLLRKTKQLRERADRIEAAAKPAFADRPAGAIRIANSHTHSKSLVRIGKTAIVTPNGELLYNIGSLTVYRGDRIVVLGGNGSGKSRLLARIIGAVQNSDPAIRLTTSVVMGICDQTLSELVDYQTPMDAINRGCNVGNQSARAYLAASGLVFNVQDRPIGNLSGGQKARLMMLMLRIREPNFFVLDEPTNHLDIDGQEQLEKELIASDVTSVIVSHDRTFLRSVGTRFWQIKRKRLEEVDSPEDFISEQLNTSH